MPVPPVASHMPAVATFFWKRRDGSRGDSLLWMFGAYQERHGIALERAWRAPGRRQVETSVAHADADRLRLRGIPTCTPSSSADRPHHMMSYRFSIFD